MHGGLTRDRVAFLTVAGASAAADVPFLILAAGESVAAMPLVSQEVGVDPPVAVPGWRLKTGLMLCVVDGDQDGFLIGPLVMPGDDTGVVVAELNAWCEHVDRVGGAWVVLLSESILPPHPSVDAYLCVPGARAGFVPLFHLAAPRPGSTH
jgi:hypothetical protein